MTTPPLIQNLADQLHLKNRLVTLVLQEKWDDAYTTATAILHLELEFAELLADDEMPPETASGPGS